MSTENPSGQSPQGPEQKEWQGQRWEYLFVQLSINSIEVVGRRNAIGIKGKPSPDPLVERYNQMIDEHRKEISGESVRDHLNLLGNDGWEVIAAGTNLTYTLSLVLKRPLSNT